MSIKRGQDENILISEWDIYKIHCSSHGLLPWQCYQICNKTAYCHQWVHTIHQSQVNICKFCNWYIHATVYAWLHICSDTFFLTNPILIKITITSCFRVITFFWRSDCRKQDVQWSVKLGSGPFGWRKVVGQTGRAASKRCWSSVNVEVALLRWLVAISG